MKTIKELPITTEIPSYRNLLLPVVDGYTLVNSGKIYPLYRVSVDELVNKIAEYVSEKSGIIKIIKTENGIQITNYDSAT